MEQRITYLWNRWKSRIATPDEQQELMEWLEREATDEQINALLSEGWDLYEAHTPVFSDEEKQRMLQKILPAKIKTFNRRITTWAAAAVIVGLLIGSYWFLNEQGKSVQNRAALTEKVKDVKPPQEARAVITLNDGSKIYLDSAGNGTLIQQNGVTVTKNAEGQIEYNNSQAAAHGSQLLYNTLVNPRGSKVVNITLSDGTRVWLNAESSLNYPMAFVGSDREVEITGEAYFEVAKDHHKKFKVAANGVTTEVLGTHFNVNAYHDEEDTRITLLEGSVKVLNSKGAVTIEPGEQAHASSNIKPLVDNNADIDEVMAWKNNLFVFNGVKIRAVMRQIARWYDVDVQYKGNITNDDFVGMVSRTSNVSQVLKMMETTKKVKFQVSENTIVVMSP